MKTLLIWGVIFVGGVVFTGIVQGKQHFEPVDATGEFSNIIINNGTIDNGQFQNGDEIAVFDDTLCVGAVVYTSPFPVSCPAMMEYISPANDTLEGARRGNLMHFKVWQKNAGIEMGASAVCTSGGHFGDVLTVVDPLSGSTTGITEEIPESHIPERFDLFSNYPNPFNPATTIRYHLPVAVKTIITVYDMMGKQICTLVDEFKQTGRYTVQWDGRSDDGVRVSTGNYIVTIQAGDFSKSLKILLVK